MRLYCKERVEAARYGEFRWVVASTGEFGVNFGVGRVGSEEGVGELN